MLHAITFSIIASYKKLLTLITAFRCGNQFLKYMGSLFSSNWMGVSGKNSEGREN